MANERDRDRTESRNESRQLGGNEGSSQQQLQREQQGQGGNRQQGSESERGRGGGQQQQQGGGNRQQGGSSPNADRDSMRTEEDQIGQSGRAEGRERDRKDR